MNVLNFDQGSGTASPLLVGFSESDGYCIALRERPKNPPIPGMRRLRQYFPTVVQHACNMLVHRLHARKQPLPVILPRPISFVRKRLHFHVVTASAFFLAPLELP